MKRAARWFRGLLGRKKTAAPESTPAKEKGKWGFVKSFREREKGDQLQQQLSGEMATPPSRVLEERKGSYKEAGRPYAAADPAADGEERSKRAIAVAAATAAVADAAVAAAQAAAAVVRLTSSGRRVIRFGGAKREEWAAVKIQATFRGYLARRALRALKGLVKLQALVRGNIVRKQAAETLRCMQALVRVQARARACRALRTETSKPNKGSHTNLDPQTPEKYEPAIQTNAMKSGRPCTLKRNSSKQTSTGAANTNRAQSSGWNWLDRWMDERYWDGRETSAKAGNGASTDDEKNAKILEIDTGKPQLNPKRMSNHLHSSFSTLTSDQNSHSFTTVPDTPSKDSTTAQQSILSPSSVDKQQSPLPLRFPAFFEARDFEESPQFYSASSSRPGTTRRGAFTPAKSDCSRSLFGEYPDYPNYMANTESSRAKARSHSAPKQRPDFENNEKSCLIKRVSANGSSVAAAAAQKSSVLHSKFTNKAYPGSGRLDRLGMPIRI